MAATLYHYTEYVAFDGILNKGILRLNNILNMNDASEMHLFINAIREAVVKKLTDVGKIDAAQRFENLVYEEMEQEFYYSAYAACFSRYKDDASQWDRYGRAGQGVCIGFDERNLEKLMGGSLSLQQVFYESDVANHLLVDQLYDIASKDVYNEDKIRSIMDKAWVQSAAFKHPSFSSENEVRMVVSPFIADEFAVAPQYNIAHNRIKKYYPLDLKEFCKRNGIKVYELITEIIIGPTSTQSKAILEDYLEDCGLPELSSKIEISKCPLRTPGL